MEAFRSPVPASAVGAALLSMPGWDAPTFSWWPPRLSSSLSSSSLWGVLAAGAVVLASVGGGMFLNPIDRLTGGGGNGNGNGNGGLPGGGSGGGSNRNDNDPVGGGMFENANAEEETKEKERGEAMVVGVTAAPRPYEVSVRALRGGPLSMEDKFVVVGGSRLSFNPQPSESFGLSWRISPFITYIPHEVLLFACIWMEASALVHFLDDLFALIHTVILL
mmetsp:Transcript_2001/g.4140  ORF Transcript_2001/g.4140 Transcript_2001/m.4140 type:complete len:220 (+) Transcript_2001:387-1046(+)